MAVDPRLLLTPEDPGMSPLGPAVGPPPAPTPLGTAAPGPVATTPLAAPTEGVPPMLAAPEQPQPTPLTAPAGAITGAVTRAPTWSTPGGMRRDTVESVRTPGASAAVDRAEALYGAASQLDIAAQEKLAATADAQAAEQERAAAAARQMTADLEARERARQARVDQEAQRYLEAAKGADEERPTLASARDGVGWGSLALLTIAQGILGANAGAQGREPPDLVGAAINRQLQDQRAKYEMGRQQRADKASAAQTAYTQLRAMGADAREADLAYASRVRQQAIETLQRQMARITDPARKAAAAAEIARQQAKQAEAMAELRAKVGDKVTEREKYQAPTSGGGQLMVSVQMPDGRSVQMPMAQAKQYQELMGQTPEQRLKQREVAIKAAEAGIDGAGGADAPKDVLTAAREYSSREGDQEANLRRLQKLKADLEAQMKKHGTLPGLNNTETYTDPLGLGKLAGRAMGTDYEKDRSRNIQTFEALKGSLAAANPGAESDSEWAMFERQLRGAGDAESMRRAVDELEQFQRAQLANTRAGFSPKVREFVEKQRRQVAQEEAKRSAALKPRGGN